MADTAPEGRFTASRRALLAFTAVPFAGGIPFAAAVGLTAQRRAILASTAADARFAALPDDLEFRDNARWRAEQAAMIAAYDAVSTASPVDWSELVTLIAFVTDEGSCGMTEEATAAVMRHARGLEVRHA